MARTKATELADQHKKFMQMSYDDAKKLDCPICNPRKDRIPEWKVWAWMMAQPAPCSPFKRAT